jgi:hypothetical protein
VLALRYVAQLERLPHVVVSLIRLIIQNHVNVIARVLARVFAGLVAFIAAHVETYLNGRARDGRAFARLDEANRGAGLILLAALRHLVFDFLRSLDD